MWLRRPLTSPRPALTFQDRTARQRDIRRTRAHTAHVRLRLRARRARLIVRARQARRIALARPRRARHARPRPRPRAPARRAHHEREAIF